MTQTFYKSFTEAQLFKKKLMAILIDPEKFEIERAAPFLRSLPKETTHLFVGGSTVPEGMTEALVKELKLFTAKPIILFPGNVSQITHHADGLLFLSLLSGRNPEYLIEQHIKAVPKLRETSLEIIPTAYILIEGGNESAVANVTHTTPLSQGDIPLIVDTAKAGEWMGKKLVYLEAGSGAKNPVSPEIVSAVKKEISIPLIVGGGIKTEAQLKQTYEAGADMIVMGTAFEK